ncbi:hypothetical protein PILCRDRAFT_91749 [Piloderma croceum F 1598]|uniref:Uncharacterized protein n=1 Tax=Piloderma croceum (strain F 1598) TaxID=765440 RepID=A0A0C3BFN4_PILCF|nr:hypothetical protein PILCRDRAFT_91749 [Piloderma croceum F 1598]
MLFHYGQTAKYFPPSLENLIVRPQNNTLVLPDNWRVQWRSGRTGFWRHLSKWTTIRVICVESPGFVVFPTLTNFNTLVGIISSEITSKALETVIIHCRYGWEVENPDPSKWDNTELYQQLTGTLWEDRVEGLNNYFLPRPPPNSYLYNRCGGIYEISKNKDGQWEGGVGEMPEIYTWSDDYGTTFNFA